MFGVVAANRATQKVYKRFDALLPEDCFNHKDGARAP